MPNDRLTGLFLTFVVIFAIWFSWWASWGFPFEHQICGNGETAPSCPSYNIFLFSVWRLAEFWGVLITAIATAAVAYFTWTIWRVNRSQLERNQEVERAYVSGGGARHLNRYVQPKNLSPIFEPNTGYLNQPDGTVIVVVPTTFFELHINNHGKTPARLHHARVGFCDAAAPPPEPPYESIFSEVDNIGPGTQSRFLRLINIPQGRFARTAICGRFYWADIWGREWSSGFIYEIPGGPALPNDSLSIEAPPAYTQERPEAPEVK